MNFTKNLRNDILIEKLVLQNVVNIALNVNVTSSGMHSVCVCAYHQNVKLLSAAIPHKIDYRELIQWRLKGGGG